MVLTKCVPCSFFLFSILLSFHAPYIRTRSSDGQMCGVCERKTNKQTNVPMRPLNTTQAGNDPVEDDRVDAVTAREKSTQTRDPLPNTLEHHGGWVHARREEGYYLICQRISVVWAQTTLTAVKSPPVF